MLHQVIIALAVFTYVDGSGIGHAPATGPVVTSASSQYFERTFNRLVAAPPQVLVPAPAPPPQAVVPVPQPNQVFIPAPAPPPVVLQAQPPPVLASPPQQFIHVPPQQPVFTPQHAVFVSPVPNNTPAPANPVQPTPDATQQPNVAIAVATAHAAAPVATILLPPYPFGFPPGFGYIQPEQPVNVPEEKPKETTTPVPTTRITEATTTVREPETTPVPSNSDNSFVQALPSNENVNFKQYGLPLPQPQLPQFQGCKRCNGVLPQRQPLPQAEATGQSSSTTTPVRPWPQQPKPQGWSQHVHYHIKDAPQKLKTSVEVVPIPLAYIAPPPATRQQPHRHIKIIKHIYGFAAEPSSKVIIREVPTSLRIRQVKRPAHTYGHKAAIATRSVLSQNQKPLNKNAEPTTFRPLSGTHQKPPKV